MTRKMSDTEARNKRLARRHGRVWMRVPYQCECGARGEVKAELAAGMQIIHHCPKCLKPMQLTAR